MTTQSMIGMLFVGFLAGILSGMFGIGGGLVIVPALIVFIGLPTKVATGTSLFALLFPVGILGVMEYYRTNQLNIKAGTCVAIGLFLGTYFGARLTHFFTGSSMKRTYAIFLVVVGAYLLLTTKDKTSAGIGAAAASPATTPSAIEKNAAESDASR